MATRSFQWWHAVLIFLAANLSSGLPAGFSGDQAFYNSFQLPSISPPDWLFPPMWLFLNITSLVALYRVANAPASVNRTVVLAAEAVGWVLFSIFATLYFWLHSPILASVDTVCYGVLTLLSCACCLRIDGLATALIAPRLAWLALASYVSVYGALYNADPFFRSWLTP
jgi:benzodiazapine receptor